MIISLVKLEEEREWFKQKLHQHQQIMKHWFDGRYSSDRDIEVGDLVLKWDKAYKDKAKNSKFDRLWLGPFILT